MLEDILSFFPRTEKWQSTKSERKNESRDYLLKQRYVYLYKLTIHKLWNKTVYFKERWKSFCDAPNRLIFFITVRPFVFLFAFCRNKYISIFVYLNLIFFYSYMYYLPPLNGWNNVDTVKSPNQSMCYLYIKFQTLDNKLRKLKHLVIRSSYMSILLNVLVLNINRCITYVDFV